MRFVAEAMKKRQGDYGKIGKFWRSSFRMREGKVASPKSFILHLGFSMQIVLIYLHVNKFQMYSYGGLGFSIFVHPVS